MLLVVAAVWLLAGTLALINGEFLSAALGTLILVLYLDAYRRDKRRQGS